MIIYFFDWIINVNVFRQNAKQFYENIVEYRQFQIFFYFVNFKLSIDQLSIDNFVINNSFFTDVISKRQINLDFAVFRINRFRNVNDSFVVEISIIRLFVDFDSVFIFNVLSLTDSKKKWSIVALKLRQIFQLKKLFTISQLSQAHQLQSTCFFSKTITTNDR